MNNMEGCYNLLLSDARPLLKGTRVIAKDMWMPLVKIGKNRML